MTVRGAVYGVVSTLLWFLGGFALELCHVTNYRPPSLLVMLSAADGTAAGNSTH
jgi:hypothetical protein